jgi:hypothetical protein
VSVIAYAFAKLRLHPGDAVAIALDERARQVAAHFTAQGVASTLWALSFLLQGGSAGAEGHKLKHLGADARDGQRASASSSLHGASARKLRGSSSEEKGTPCQMDAGQSRGDDARDDGGSESDSKSAHGRHQVGDGARALMTHIARFQGEICRMRLIMIATALQRLPHDSVHEAAARTVWTRASAVMHELDVAAVVVLWDALRNVDGKGLGDGNELFITRLLEKTDQNLARMTCLDLLLVLCTCAQLRLQVAAETLDRIEARLRGDSDVMTREQNAEFDNALQKLGHNARISTVATPLQGELALDHTEVDASVLKDAQKQFQ